MSKYITQWQFHFRLSSPFRDCPAEAALPKATAGSWGSPQIWCGGYKGCVLLPQLKTALMGQSIFRTLKKDGGGSCWNWIASLFLHVPNPGSFPVTGIIPNHWWWTGVRAEGNTLASYERSSHERYSANSSYEDYGIGCLLLNLNEALEKDKEKLGKISWQLQAKYKSKRASLVAYRVLLSYSRRPVEGKMPTQELIIRLVSCK